MPLDTSRRTGDEGEDHDGYHDDDDDYDVKSFHLLIQWTKTKHGTSASISIYMQHPIYCLPV